MNPIFERARAASKALAEHRQRQRVLHDVIRLGEASIAALQTELAQEQADKLKQVTQQLDHFLLRAKHRANTLDRIAPGHGTRIEPRGNASTPVVSPTLAEASSAVVRRARPRS